MLIQCEHVDLGYSGRTVVHDLSFTVDAGDLLCVIGENGAGKSTLIKTLLGLIEPVQGKIQTSRDFDRRTIGYLPQQTEIQRSSPASVREIVRSGCLNASTFRPFYSQEEKERAEITMNRLGIGSIASQCFRELSGGQQQRVLLARALCATSGLLILDEPAAGLDPTATADMYRLICELNKKDGITVIMVTHDLRGSLDMASHILHMAHIPLFFGTTAEYRESEIAKTFLSRIHEEI